MKKYSAVTAVPMSNTELGVFYIVVLCARLLPTIYSTETNVLTSNYITLQTFVYTKLVVVVVSGTEGLQEDKTRQLPLNGLTSRKFTEVN